MPLKVVNSVSLFPNYLHLNRLELLSPRNCCAELGWNWASDSREGVNVKSWETNGRTDRRQRRGDQKFSSGELKKEAYWTFDTLSTIFYAFELYIIIFNILNYHLFFCRISFLPQLALQVWNLPVELELKKHTPGWKPW